MRNSDLTATSLLGYQLGQYKIVAELGRGQHSVVYKAWQLSLERHVALKVLQHHDQDTLRKFQAEARLTAYLIDQGVTNIRQVYEVGQTADGYLFVALEYVEDSLRSVLGRAREQGRRMEPAAAARLLAPVAQALDAIHSLGWVHLDVKPENILLTRDGRPTLADLGIANKRGTCTHACTPTYASPEQAAGDRPVGPWCDVYSLGAVLYEMVAGHPPVRGEHDVVLLNQHLEAVPPSPRRVNPQLTVGQERAVLKALAKSPKDRYTAAGELTEAMLSPETFLSSVIQTPRNVVGTTSGWIRRIPPLVWIGALVVLLAIVVAVGAVLWAGAGHSTQTPAAGVTASTGQPAGAGPTAVASATATRTPTVTLSPTATVPPTVTLAPRPTATATRPARTATASATP